MRDYFWHELRRIGDGARVGVLLWRSWIDRSASQPADGIAGQVLNLDNGRSVILRIVDRGPFIRGRVIDVSTAAAEALGFRNAGLAHVKIDAISPETREPGPRPGATDDFRSLIL